MTTELHYTGCGLDDIYLVNSFTSHETEYGSGVSIQNIDELQRVIGRHIVLSGTRICGQEVRFLRSMLDLSQSKLARLLGSTRGGVARWEGKRNTPIPKAPDRLLRLFYAQTVEGSETVQLVMDLLEGMEETTMRLRVSRKTRELG